MKKLILVLACGLLLTSCAPAGGGSSSGSADAAGSISSAAQSAESTPEKKPAPKPEEPEAVKAAVQMYEGVYRDELSYSEQGGHFEGDYFIQDNYYGVEVRNITDTSFDFTLISYEGEGVDEKTPHEVTSGTARFVEDGMKAVCDDLTFVFPDTFESLPDVVDLRIEGFEPVAETTFANNNVPGHEFG